MVRLCAALAFTCLAVTESMSVTKQFSNELRSAKQLPKNFLVLRLAHTGSSWLTSMIGAQKDTYITREAMWPMHKDEDAKVVESLGKEGVQKYLERALTEPCGNILEQDTVQFLCDSTQEQWGNSLVANVASEGAYIRPETCDCIREQGANCQLKHLGMTLDPTSQVLKDNLEEIFTNLRNRYPDMPVLVLRRSNVVKRSLASGGQGTTAVEGGYSVDLGREVDVDTFMNDLQQAVESDKILRQAAEYFPHVKTISYEDLFNHPSLVMDRVFKHLGMDGGYEDWMGEIGDKHTPDDLRILIKNFDEVEAAVEKRSPCFAEQFRAKENEKFAEPCVDL